VDREEQAVHMYGNTSQDEIPRLMKHLVTALAWSYLSGGSCCNEPSHFLN